MAVNMRKEIAMSIIMVMFALSFLILLNLPEYITESSELSIIVHVLWALGFSVAFIKTAIG